MNPTERPGRIDSPSQAYPSGQLDPLRRTRLRWRARRGLLENDIVLTRFLDKNLDAMSESEVQGFDELLELTDNDLLDLILARKELQPDQGSDHAKRVLELVRAA